MRRAIAAARRIPPEAPRPLPAQFPTPRGRPRATPRRPGQSRRLRSAEVATSQKFRQRRLDCQRGVPRGGKGTQGARGSQTLARAAGEKPGARHFGTACARNGAVQYCASAERAPAFSEHVENTMQSEITIGCSCAKGLRGARRNELRGREVGGKGPTFVLSNSYLPASEREARMDDPKTRHD